MSTTVTYKGATLTTAENQTRTLKTAGTYLEDDITVTDVTSGGSAPNLQSKTLNVSSAGTTTIAPDSGYDGLSDVKVTVPNGSLSDIAIPTTAFSGGINSDGRLVMEIDEIFPASPVSQNGFVNASDSVLVFVYGTKNVQLPTQGAITITPSESQQTAVTAGNYTTGDVSVGAIPSTYVGSGVTRRSSSDLTASGATVTAPAGYYSEQATKTIASGSATASAAKGTVSNHSVSVTPSVTRTAGYVTAGSANGTPVTVSASELVSGSQTITENGTVDVTNLAEVVVNVPTGSAKNVQAYRGYATVTATSYTATAVTITVAKTGTYNVSWMGWRNTNSGTSGSQLYRNNTAVGSANTSFVGTYGHSVSLTNQTFNQGDVLVVRARARSTSYQMVVGNLIIEEV